MRGFTRPPQRNGLNAALEALIKMVDHRLCYNKKTADLPTDCFERSITNMNQLNKERIANAPARHYDQF